MYKKIKRFTIYILNICIISMPFLCMPHALHAAYNTLEIINIKPAGTGSPAISKNHRIFRAYPGIEYNIRAAVIGGMYPYKYSLSNAPNGMIINETTGVIRWPNPQTSAESIRLTVTDSENHTATSTWSIAVTTNGFIFVDDSYTGTEVGTPSQPYNSIQDILNLTGRESDIVYFRAGSYPVPIYQPSYWLNIGCNISGSLAKPHIWLGYPGENVTINMDKHYFEIGGEATPYYFDNLRFYNSFEFGFRSSSASNYATFYRCEIDTITTNQRGNGNQGFYFTSAQGTGKYLVFQDCVFHDYTGTAGIGSLYQQDKMLIEGCSFFNQYDGSTGICTAIAAKVAISNSTIRGNKAVVSAGSVLGTGVNGMLADAGYGPSVNNEVCFNNFRHTSGSHVHWFNNNGDQQSMYYYRNTCVGRLLFRSLTGDCGPFVLSNNIIVNSAYGDYEYYNNDPGPNVTAYITDKNNWGSKVGIVDGNGMLIDRSYVGIYGWETSNINSLPTAPAAPTGITISIINN